MTKAQTPFLVVNPKSYLYGEKSLELAKAADKVAKETGIQIYFTCPFADIRYIKENTENIIVTAQHMDPLAPGRADDSYMVETIQKLHEANPDVLVMIASGVSTADDVYHILKLGADGTGATSGILNAPSPAGRIQEWADAVIKLQNEQKEGKQYEII